MNSYCITRNSYIAVESYRYILTQYYVRYAPPDYEVVTYRSLVADQVINGIRLNTKRVGSSLNVEFFPSWEEKACRVELLRKKCSETDEGAVGATLLTTSSNTSIDIDVRDSASFVDDSIYLLHVVLPQYFGICAVVESGSVVVHDKVEAANGSVDIRCDDGSVVVDKLRAERISLHAARPFEENNRIQGLDDAQEAIAGTVSIRKVAEGSLRIEGSAVDAKQLLGPKAYVEIVRHASRVQRRDEDTRNNDDDDSNVAVRIGALYCDKTSIRTNEADGAVHLGTVQGHCTIESVDDVVIDSVVGELDVVAKRASVRAHFEKCVEGVGHSIHAPEGSVRMTTAAPCLVALDLKVTGESSSSSQSPISLDPACFRGEISANGFEAKGLFEASSGWSSSPSSSTSRSSGKISSDGRSLAALESASSAPRALDAKACEVTSFASSQIVFEARSWRDIMEETISKRLSKKGI
eukprot:g885.t1